MHAVIYSVSYKRHCRRNVNFFAEVGDLASARAILLHHPEHFINFSWLISSSMMSTPCRQKVTILESEVIGTIIYLELGVTH